MSRFLQLLSRSPSLIYRSKQWMNYLKSNKLSTKSNKITEFNPEKDVTRNYVLYRANYISTLQMVQLFSFGSFALWLYLAMFVRDFVQDEPREVEKMKIKETGRNEDSKLYSTWDKYTHVSDKYKWSLCIFCVVMGYGSLFVCGVYVSKCIHGLTLLKGGREVLVQTPQSLSFIPKFNEKVYPVTHFSSMTTRESAKGYMPIKIKGKPLYFLLKTSGEFPNPLLFDKTVGRYRKL